MDSGYTLFIHYLIYLLNKQLSITYYVSCPEPGIGHTMENNAFLLIHEAEGLMRVYSQVHGQLQWDRQLQCWICEPISQIVTKYFKVYRTLHKSTCAEVRRSLLK